MTRLIDADALRKDISELPNCPNGFSDTYDKAMILSVIDEQPTIDAVPVRHGKWIYRDTDGKCRPWWEKYTCSVCGENAYNTNYCPNCGAKMDAERRPE